MPELTDLRAGDPTRIAGYQVLSRLGSGGQGVVYLATDPTGRRVAIKQLLSALEDERARQQFGKEVAAARRVAPFCTAQVLDVQLEGPSPYVVSEYIDGPSLQQQIRAHGPMAGAVLHRLAIGTVTALAAIHQAGVVHRDFKPANVMLAADGPRVIDFGIARDLSTETTVTSRVFGTPAYMAPEQLRAERVGPAADMFAWASVVAYAGNGRAPFEASHVMAVVYRITSGEPDLAGLPDDLLGLLRHCLDRDPARRPTAQQALATLLGRPIPARDATDATTVLAAAAGLVHAAGPGPTLAGSSLAGSAPTDPATVDPATVDPATVDPVTVDPVTGDRARVDPGWADRTTVDLTRAEPARVDLTSAGPVPAASAGAAVAGSSVAGSLPSPGPAVPGSVPGGSVADGSVPAGSSVVAGPAWAGPVRSKPAAGRSPIMDAEIHGSATVSPVRTGAADWGSPAFNAATPAARQAGPPPGVQPGGWPREMPGTPPNSGSLPGSGGQYPGSQTDGWGAPPPRRPSLVPFVAGLAVAVVVVVGVAWAVLRFATGGPGTGSASSTSTSTSHSSSSSRSGSGGRTSTSGAAPVTRPTTVGQSSASATSGPPVTTSGSTGATGTAAPPGTAVPPVASVPPGTVPARFAGDWRGEAYQPKGIAPQWTAEIHLTEGTTAGTLEVVGLDCTEALTVRSASAGLLVLDAVVVRDPAGTCAPHGTLRLTTLGAKRLSFHWQDAQHATNVATGQLRPV